jgi:hypothetical protein
MKDTPKGGALQRSRRFHFLQSMPPAGVGTPGARLASSNQGSAQCAVLGHASEGTRGPWECVMRRTFVGLAFLTLSACVTYNYGPAGAKGPSYAGQVAGVSFDRDRVTGVRVVMRRADDGSWAGHWTCMLVGAPRINEMCVGRVRMEEGMLYVQDKVEFPIISSERGDMVAIQEPWGDLTFRRLDKSPIPTDAIPMLWIAYRTAQLEQGKVKELPTQNVNVDGVGVVEIKDRQPRAFPGYSGYLPSPT